MASPINALSASAALNNTTSPGKTAGSSTAPNQEIFLQLLVAQLQNQDPMNPADSTQFVSQLAQFSQLEQVIGIRQDIEAAQSSSAVQGAGTDNSGQVSDTTSN